MDAPKEKRDFLAYLESMPASWDAVVARLNASWEPLEGLAGPKVHNGNNGNVTGRTAAWN